MNSIQCKNCGLTNFSTETECRRCGNSFLKPAKTKRGKSPRRFSFGSLLMIAVVAGLAYYFYSGTQSSIEQINANDAKRVASQPPAQRSEQGLSRSEYDRQRSMTYGEAVKNSSSLAAHQQHINQTEKVMQQISNNQTPR